MTPALIGISLKMYLSANQTKTWISALEAELRARPSSAADAEVFVLPSFPLLEATSKLLSNSLIRWGAQDLAPSANGAQTGEVAGAVLRELGCSYVEIGHAERRSLFGETEAVVVDKMRQAFANDLVPVLCIGEDVRGSTQFAAEHCTAQLVSALDGDLVHDLVVAYEPVWAIGAAQAADPEHVSEVCSVLRQATADRVGRTHLLYGGSAGPGTFDALDGSVDGVFLGRFGHDVSNVVAVLDEIKTHRMSSACD